MTANPYNKQQSKQFILIQCTVAYIPPESEHTVVAEESLMLSSQIHINFKLSVTTDWMQITMNV